MASGGNDLQTTNHPIYGAASILVNDTIYIYGGFYNVPPWNQEAMWVVDKSASTIKQVPTDPYASPAVIYTSLQSVDNKTLLALGGHLIEKDIMQLSNNITNTPEYLRYYRFNFDQLKWTPLQKKVNSTNIEISPLERFWHTTVISQDHSSIYLFGGVNITHAINDFWKYNTLLNSWTELSLGTKARCGHTSTMLNDGKIVNLGGFDCSDFVFIQPVNKILFSLEAASVFDSISSVWYEKNLGGSEIPKSRTFHTAVKTNDDRIIICGGQDHNAEPVQNYLSTNNPKEMTAILDLNTWNWRIPNVSPYQPFPRSHATANIINETLMIYGFGVNYHTVFDDFSIFNLTSNTWIPPNNIEKYVTPQSFIKSNVSLVIFLSVLGGLSVMAILLYTGYILLKKKSFSLKLTLKKLKSSIWEPRAGEPIWAEIYRLLFRFSFTIMLILFSAILFLQVQNSPIIDQEYYEHSLDNGVNVPDIRFCFDGWKEDPIPFIQCVTDYGEPCSQYLINITENTISNVHYYGGKLNCHLFKAPLILGKDDNRVRFNGSNIKFYYYGVPKDKDSTVHAEFYHHFHDPNIPSYNITSLNNQFDKWYSPDESTKFQSIELMNLKTENTFNIQPDTKYTIGYTFVERKKLVPNNIGNYIGFTTTTESQYFVKTNKISSTPKPQSQTPSGVIIVYPTRYDTYVISEQRAFTFMNGMGIIGGIFGLLVGFQVSLFGYRPQSPWGMLHRWSIHLMQKSLLKGLKSKLQIYPDVHVPIVHPVNQRYSEVDSPIVTKKVFQKSKSLQLYAEYEDKTINEETEMQRMAKIEERLHIFELLFQAYYIDDEVFRSLQEATKCNHMNV